MSGVSARASLRGSCTGPTGRRGGSIPTCSLNDAIKDEDGNLIGLSDTLDEEDGRRRVGNWRPSQVELCDLAMGVGHVLSRLPSRLRRLCERLKTTSVSGLSRLTGVPEAKLHEDIGKLRAAFEEAGLAKYLSGGSVPVSADEANDGC